MINRAYIHITGQPGAGTTTLMEAVLGPHCHRTPVTAVVSNLADPKDPGRKKVMARVKRAIKAGKEG